MTDDSKTQLVEAIGKLSASTICLGLLGGHLYFTHQTTREHNEQVREIMRKSNDISALFIERIDENGQHMDDILNELVKHHKNLSERDSR